MKVFEQASDLIGNTPLVRLNGYQKEKKLDAELLAKLEYFNRRAASRTGSALHAAGCTGKRTFEKRFRHY